MKALEEDDHEHLPGRTLIRDFLRNYVRLLRLDAAVILAALPEANAAQPSENPRSRRRLARSANCRWIRRLVAVVALDDTTRDGRAGRRHRRLRTHASAGGNSEARHAGETAPAPTPAPSPPASDTTALPNPLVPPPDKADANPVGVPDKLDAGASPAMPPMAAEPTEGTIAFSFLGTSWVEVRDASGAVVLSATGYAGGNKQAASGRPPLDVVLGNANAVSVTWQGRPFDIAPYTKQNVAKFTLQ